MPVFSMDSWLDDIISLAKKLGIYEHRFDITSEQMFGIYKRKDLSNKKIPPIDNLEWGKYYKEYTDKRKQFQAIIDSFMGNTANQSEVQRNSTQRSTTPISLSELLEYAKAQELQQKAMEQLYTPSEEDRRTFTEISLPIGASASNPYSFGGFGKITASDRDLDRYSALINLRFRVPVSNVDFDLIKIQNGIVLSIPQSISCKNHNYPPEQVSYRLEADQEFWQCLTTKIDEINKVNGESYYHLSIFVDETKIRESNYKVKYLSPYPKRDNNNLARLEIPIEVKKFETSKGIYWLKEAGEPIEFEWLVDPYGRFGCLGNKVYPITQSQASYQSQSFNSRKCYELYTPQHNLNLGRIALNNCQVGLKRLEGIIVWEGYGDADKIFKWDLFLKVNNTVYPLQIKSSIGKAQEALSEYKTQKLPFIPPIIWLNPTKSKESAEKLVEDLAMRFSKIFDTPLSTNKIGEVLFLPENDTRPPRSSKSI